jgi:DNA-binding NarL/FixJ family response regulator
MRSELETIKLIIADDSDDFVEGLSTLLATQRNIKILQVYKDGLSLIKSPLLSIANLLLTDIAMPGMSGLAAARYINYRYPWLPMIAVTMYKDRIYLNDILGAGFKGFVYKPDTAEKLLPAIEAVMMNKFNFPKGIKRDII